MTDYTEIEHSTAEVELVQRLAAAAAVKKLCDLQKASTKLGSIPWRRVKAEAVGLHDRLYEELQGMLREGAQDPEAMYREAIKGILDVIPRSGLAPLHAAQALLAQARGT